MLPGRGGVEPEEQLGRADLLLGMLRDQFLWIETAQGSAGIRLKIAFAQLLPAHNPKACDGLHQSQHCCCIAIPTSLRSSARMPKQSQGQSSNAQLFCQS